MAQEDHVRAVSDRFYAALNAMANGDASGMADVWVSDSNALAMHPNNERDLGWDEVQASFDGVAQASSDGDIQLVDQVVRVSGDTACEVGREQGSFCLAGQRVELDHRVTNVYRRTDEGWKMVHHHAEVSSAMMAVLATL